MENHLLENYSLLFAENVVGQTLIRVVTPQTFYWLFFVLPLLGILIFMFFLADNT